MLALGCPPLPVAAQSVPRTPRIGLWIEAEGKLRTLDARERLAAALDHAEALGATDLFVQVYRDGRAWFPTESADDGPWRRARERGFDALALALSRAHARGARVHAWVNLLRVDRPAGGQLLGALGEGAVLRGTGGVEPVAGWAPDTPGAWLDPASPEVGARLGAVLSDLLRAYPALDGVHFDYVRYPFPVRDARGVRAGSPAAFGTTAASLARFRNGSAGGPSPRNPSADDRAAYESWRRERLTDLLRGLRRVLESARPGVLLSAAVMPEPDAAARRSGQDWPRWTQEGILDLAVPMDYATEIVAFERAARACVERRGKARVLIGIGAWRLGGDAGAIAARVRRAIDLGADGAVLFSHDNLASRRDLFKRIGDLLEAEGIVRRSSPPRAPPCLDGLRGAD